MRSGLRSGWLKSTKTLPNASIIRSLLFAISHLSLVATHPIVRNLGVAWHSLLRRSCRYYLLLYLRPFLSRIPGKTERTMTRFELVFVGSLSITLLLASILRPACPPVTNATAGLCGTLVPRMCAGRLKESRMCARNTSLKHEGRPATRGLNVTS